MAKLDSSVLDAAVLAYTRYMEGANSAPYRADFAGTGTSGLSFGLLQNDVANNGGAATVFRQILTNAGLPGSEVNRLVALASLKGVTEDQFSPTDRATINSALVSQSALVDAQDIVTAKALIGSINQLLDAAALNPNGPGVLSAAAPDPTALAMAAAWSNQTNGLAEMSPYFQALATPITLAAVQTYISTRVYFTTSANPGNFTSWMVRINEAVAANPLTYQTIDPATTHTVTVGGNSRTAVQANADGTLTIASTFALPGQGANLVVLAGSGAVIGDIAPGAVAYNLQVGTDGVSMSLPQAGSNLTFKADGTSSYANAGGNRQRFFFRHEPRVGRRLSECHAGRIGADHTLSSGPEHGPAAGLWRQVLGHDSE